MKHRFSARETALVLLPTLALGAFAWYLQRVEGVGRRGLYVESSKIVPATPLDVSRGNSHYVKVTLNYGGSKPKWWTSDGDFQTIYSSADPFQKDAGEWLKRRPDYFAAGSCLTVSSRGKQISVNRSRRTPRLEREGGRYIVTHHVSLSAVPPQKGAVTFHSIYRMRDLPPLTWQRIVRRKGENVSPIVDHNPHATIVSLKRRPHTLPDMAIEVQVKHPPREDGQPARFSWDDIEIVDSQARVFRHGFDFNIGVSGPISVNEDPSLSLGVLGIMPFPRGLRNVRPPLTLRGKISVNDNWPIPFSHRLSP